MCGQCTTNILNYFFVYIGRFDTSSKSTESGSEDDMLVPRVVCMQLEVKRLERKVAIDLFEMSVQFNGFLFTQIEALT
jgi:hypothetical protein